MKRESFTIKKPDDAHLHLRDGTLMRTVLPYTCRDFQRAIIMPNLTPEIDTVSLCRAYRRRILRHAAVGFEPLMTLYMKEDMHPSTIAEASRTPYIHGIKLYPRGATTNSSAGVSNLRLIYPILEAMQKFGMPLLVHGEDNAAATDCFESEQVFIDRSLLPMCKDFPSLKIVFEHITTSDAVAFVQQNSGQAAATITPHHLCYSRNALFSGGVNPHLYCRPLLQHERHRQALVKAATSGLPCFFLGTDSAPHPLSNKETSCGCAGIFNTNCALAVYAGIFDQENALDKFENFASLYAARFYNLPPNTARIELRRSIHTVEKYFGNGEHKIIPMLAGQTVKWSVVH